MVGYFIAGMFSGFAVMGAVVGVIVSAILGVVWMLRRMPW